MSFDQRNQIGHVFKVGWQYFYALCFPVVCPSSVCTHGHLAIVNAISQEHSEGFFFKLCKNVHSNSRMTRFDFQGHRLKVKVTAASCVSHLRRWNEFRSNALTISFDQKIFVHFWHIWHKLYLDLRLNWLNFVGHRSRSVIQTSLQNIHLKIWKL